MSELLSLTELGKLYGVSSHKVGKWLVSAGIRTPAKKPSSTAFREGYVEQRGSTQPGTYIWIWHSEKTKQALSKAGHEQVVRSPDKTLIWHAICATTSWLKSKHPGGVRWPVDSCLQSFSKW